MARIRTLIVDDEALARERVRALASRSPEIEVIAECSGGREAVDAIVELDPALVFLDVHMPDLDGFEVLEAVSDRHLPSVVFITAYDAYALRAFDVHALDYLLKPIDPDRFQQMLDRVIGRHGASTGDRLVALLDAVADRVRPTDRVVVRDKGRVVLLKPADIDWVEAEGKYVRLHVGADTHLVRQQIARMAERLAGYGFVRIHRSAIVNVDRIRELQPWFRGEWVVILEDDTRLTSSAGHGAALHRLLEDGR